MIEGVISFEPSQETPPKGLRERRRADRGAVLARCHVLEGEGPVGGGRACSDGLARRVAQLDLDAGQPELLRLDLARHAAAGFEVAPDDAGDRRAGRLRHHGLDRVRRDIGGRDRGQRRAARHRPGRAAVLQHEALRRRPGHAAASMGAASDSAPGGLNASWKTCDEGVDRPQLRLLPVHDPPDHACGEAARSPSA